ncbi:MAG: class I SAM-dependent methyltransferase [Methanoregula sp.]|nr:class I SAM-dependent methyltransferase [Methanoregula sp.]
MKDYAEDNVSKFYNNIGWKTKDDVTEDARICEDLRENASEYVSKCRLRVLKYIPDHGDNLLDMASGPIQYKEYLEYSKNFKKRYCIDLSVEALEQAKRKIEDHGVILCGSFFDIKLEKDFFDCSISLHTIYHIEKDKQEDAVRKLINVTKPGKNIVIVYSNPQSIPLIVLSLFVSPFRLLKKIFGIVSRGNKMGERKEQETDLYFFAHSNDWWNKFSDIATIKIVPWRSFGSGIQKRVIPNNRIGKKILECFLIWKKSTPRFLLNIFNIQ